jgi:hypothetical protein
LVNKPPVEQDAELRLLSNLKRWAFSKLSFLLTGKHKKESWGTGLSRLSSLGSGGGLFMMSFKRGGVSNLSHF